MRKPELHIKPTFPHETKPTPTNYMSHLQGRSRSEPDEKKDPVLAEETPGDFLEVDLTTYHEQRAGRLVLDPKCVFLSFRWHPLLISPNSEARIEFGDTVASRLKLSPDGRIVLWPQPTDDPEDPQNVCQPEECH